MKRDNAKTLIWLVFLQLLASDAFAWTVLSDEDKMTGEVSAYAVSSYVSPLEEMSFPYNDIKSWIGFGCDKKSEWAYIGFSEQPILTNSRTRDGYNLITERTKWDDQVFSMQFSQTWGSKFLHYMMDEEAILKILTESTMLLELHWYSQGTVYFQYSLEGSSKAINDARNICRK